VLSLSIICINHLALTVLMKRTSPKLPIHAGFAHYVKLVNPTDNPTKHPLYTQTVFIHTITSDKLAMVSFLFDTPSARNKIQSQEYRTPFLLNRMTSHKHRTMSLFSRIPSLLSRMPSREHRTTFLLNKTTSHKHRTSNLLYTFPYSFDNRQLCESNFQL